MMFHIYIPSVLWHCWLGGRKGIRPVNSGGVLMWLSVWSKVLTCIWPSWCRCHSLSLASVKSRLVLPFWYRLTWVVPEKEPLNGCDVPYIQVTAERSREVFQLQQLAVQQLSYNCQLFISTVHQCLENSMTLQDLALRFPRLSRTKLIFQDFPVSWNFTNTNNSRTFQNFLGGMGNLF